MTATVPDIAQVVEAAAAILVSTERHLTDCPVTKQRLAEARETLAMLAAHLRGPMAAPFAMALRLADGGAQ